MQLVTAIYIFFKHMVIPKMIFTSVKLLKGNSSYFHKTYVDMIALKQYLRNLQSVEEEIKSSTVYRFTLEVLKHELS